MNYFIFLKQSHRHTYTVCNNVMYISLFYMKLEQIAKMKWLNFLPRFCMMHARVWPHNTFNTRSAASFVVLLGLIQTCLWPPPYDEGRKKKKKRKGLTRPNQEEKLLIIQLLYPLRATHFTFVRLHTGKISYIFTLS